MSTKIQIVTAAHKPYAMPEDPIYLPMEVGADAHDNTSFTPDNQGENISYLNPYYCELTAMYWAWHNLECDYIGLAHYRRHFKGNHSGSTPLEKVINEQEVSSLLEKTDIILPKKRNYYIESVYSHYAHTHYAKDLDLTRSIIEKMYPEYIPAFDHHMKSTSSHMFNMFIMKRELLDSYCEFLFPVLFALERKVNIEEYSDFQKRLFGRISEMLLDVWIETNHLSYKEVPMISMEPVNWMKKGTAFLKAKFFGQRYKGSF